MFAGKASIALCKLVFLAAANDIMMLPTIRGEAGSTLDIGKKWKPAPPESQSHMEACASGAAGACFKTRGCARDPSGGRMHRGVCLPVLRSFELHTPPCSICTGSSPHRTHRNDAGSEFPAHCREERLWVAPREPEKRADWREQDLSNASIVLVPCDERDAEAVTTAFCNVALSYPNCDDSTRPSLRSRRQRKTTHSHPPTPPLACELSRLWPGADG